MPSSRSSTRRPSWLMSSTTPSATRNSASLARLHVENGRSYSAGLAFAIFLISRRWAKVNFGGRPPLYLGYSDPNPSALKLRITSRTRSSLVNATFAIAATSIPLGGQQHHLRPPPGHHRARAPADDPHQPPSLIIVDLPYPQPFGHRASLSDQRPPGKPPGTPAVDRYLRCWAMRAQGASQLPPTARTTRVRR